VDAVDLEADLHGIARRMTGGGLRLNEAAVETETKYAAAALIPVTYAEIGGTLDLVPAGTTTFRLRRRGTAHCGDHKKTSRRSLNRIAERFVALKQGTHP